MKLYKNPIREDWTRLCARPAISAPDLSKVVEEVFQAVKKDGDNALIEYTRRFDGVPINSVLVAPAELKNSSRQIKPDLKRAIDQAAGNIQTFHERQRQSDEVIKTQPGVKCWRETRAIEKVGLYVPGGTAPLVSTVLMLGIPAQLANCREIVLCTPPDLTGVNPAMAYAALKVGVTKFVQVGGSQAIAALALATSSIPRVDKIFGPGNQYVMAAKQLAVKYGVAIDLPAGPSEVMVVADKSAIPKFVAADLLSQAEHGPDSQVILVTDSEPLAAAVQKELAKQLAKLPRRSIAEKALKQSYCVAVDSMTGGLEFANHYAPEHLILSVKEPKKLAKQVINAGSVFLGNYSPESAGDYASGTNHVLPTNGWARSYGGVSLNDFTKCISFQSLTRMGLKNLAPTIADLAQAEGLQAHARAVQIRLK